MLLALALANFTLLAANEPGDVESAAVEIKGDVAAAAEGWSLIEQGALLIDVRSAAEFERGHIEGALNVPHTDIDAITAVIGEDRSRSVVLYCGSGRRAGLSQEMLEELGYEGVFNASGFSALQVTQP
ncbi:MAG: rhodanese-like domain-containing protein [Xanthomonadales bacterium]|nr:rhodanese-like domain-containing protein [Xanthomonadales bacterium]